jgi:hypothetical protein
MGSGDRQRRVGHESSFEAGDTFVNSRSPASSAQLKALHHEPKGAGPR